MTATDLELIRAWTGEPGALWRKRLWKALGSHRVHRLGRRVHAHAWTAKP